MKGDIIVLLSLLAASTVTIGAVLSDDNLKGLAQATAILIMATPLLMWSLGFIIFYL